MELADIAGCAFVVVVCSNKKAKLDFVEKKVSSDERFLALVEWESHFFVTETSE